MPVAHRLDLSCFWPAGRTAVGTAGTITVLAVLHGGYAPETWGWASLLAIAVGVVSLVRSRSHELRGLALGSLVALAGVVVLGALTVARPGQAGRGMLEVERGILYVAVLWAALLAIRRLGVSAAIAGTLVGLVLVCLIGLTETLVRPDDVPDRFEGRLLAQPLGYANAMGILAAMGIPLALGCAAHASARAARALTAAALVPLAVTLALTESRGAMAALLVAAVVMLSCDRHRGRLVITTLVVLPLPLLICALVSQFRVTSGSAGLTEVSADGHRLGVAIAAMTVGAAGLAFAVLRSRVQADGGVTRIAVFVATMVLAVALVGGLVSAGSFGDRAAYWRVAWADARAHPVAGSGAGSFRVAWLRERDVPRAALDAHNLYLETLAELGPLGLALLLAFFACPLVAGFLARSRPLMPAVLAAFASFAAHVALDWDWELPAVVVPALILAAIMLAARGTSETRGMIGRGALAMWSVGAFSVSVVAVIGLGGNHFLAAGIESARSGDAAGAAVLATRASTWAPWSADPLLLLGDVELAQGDIDVARVSYERAARRDKDDWRAWYALARIGDRAERDRALARLADLDPLIAWRASSP